MKKIKILRLFLTFMCFIAISFVGNNVYGYQLKYKATANMKDGKIYFLSMGTAFGAPDPTPEFETSKHYVDLTVTRGIYQTYEFMIQSSPMTIYNSKEGVDATYAYNNNKNVITIDNYTEFDKFYSKKIAKVGGKNTNVTTASIRRGVENVGKNVVSVYDGRNNGNMSVKNNFLIQGKSANFNSYQERVIDGPGVQTIMVTKWELSYTAFENMINKNKSEYVKLDKNSAEYVWYSIPCILYNANTYNENYKYVVLNTAYDFAMRF